MRKKIIKFIRCLMIYIIAGWEYLIPSVMRQQHEGINMVICDLNPRFDEDVIYDRFFNLEPP